MLIELQKKWENHVKIYGLPFFSRKYPELCRFLTNMHIQDILCHEKEDGFNGCLIVYQVMIQYELPYHLLKFYKINYYGETFISPWFFSFDFSEHDLDICSKHPMSMEHFFNVENNSSSQIEIIFDEFDFETYVSKKVMGV